MAVYLARNCPRCGNYWGVTIGKPDGSGSQSIHGRCAKCGYEIAWAIISSKCSSHIKPLTAGSKGADA
jgi:endogenous inhibitor of DNA gyrase (YacG/DUF329 family)